MNCFRAILFVTLALLASCSCQPSPGSYLQRGNKYDNHPPAYDWIKEQVSKLKPTNPKETHEVLVKLLELTRRHKLDGNYRGNRQYLSNILKQIISLADGNDYCDYDLVYHFAKLADHVYGTADVLADPRGPDHDVALFEYMKQYGKVKFNVCSISYYKKLDTTITDSAKDMEEIIDQLIASQGGHEEPTKRNDLYLAGLARQMDLIKGEFDAEKMWNVAKRFAEDTLKKYNKSYTIPWLLLNNCWSFLHPFDNFMDIFNLNRLLNGPNVHRLSDKLTKFNEYRRLCNQNSNLGTLDQVQAVFRGKFRELADEAGRKSFRQAVKRFMSKL